MSLINVIAVPNDNLPDIQDENIPFMEIHLDEQYYVEENLTFFSGKVSEHNEITLQVNLRFFWDPDQCIDFITTFKSKKVFISLTDKFSYLLPIIHDMPQILYIYIYSASPEQALYSNTVYQKLRAIVDENSPDANKQLLNDIEIFQRDLMPINVINPTQLKTKLLIHEPLPVKEYMTIWIDNTEASSDCDTKCITDVINRLEIFFNTQQCIDTIKSSFENMKIFLISSHSDTNIIVEKIAHLSNIIAIYLFDQHEQTTGNVSYSTPKIAGRYSNLKSLLNQLTYDYENLTHSSPLPMSIFHREPNQYTIRDLSKESARFIWQQLLVDILIRTPYDYQSKANMFNECRAHHKDKALVLKAIEEYEKEYQSTEALTFYTKDSFLYRLFNQALRTENIDLLFIFRFFLADMYHQLQKLYSDQFLNTPRYANSRLVVYRGQLMKTTEFEQIKNNVGDLISVNVFLSTTINKQVAIVYSDLKPDQLESNLLVVIFEIEIDLTHDATTRPYASLEHLSRFPDEEEVLLSIGSNFRILDVQDRQSSDGHWYVKMMMVEDEVDAKELRNDLEREYGMCGNLCDLGHALISMCDYDRAERHFRMLLEYLPENHPSMGRTLTGLGVTFTNRGNYQTALEFQEQALKFYTSNNSKNDVGTTYVHIGAAYRHLGQLDLALKYLSMAADIQSEPRSLSFTYNEIAITHRNRGDDRLALEYFLKTLHIDEQVSKLNKYHPSLATIYNNIGEIYHNLNDDEKSLKYLQDALGIRLKGTVSTHTDLAAIYHNLGGAHQKLGKLEEALEMHKKALEIDIQLFHDDHESIAASHHMITQIYDRLDDLVSALHHAEKGLRILLRSQAKDDRSLVAKYQLLLGYVQHRLGNIPRALNMAEKALNNQLACSSDGQVNMACTYRLLSYIYEQKEDISMALEYAEKAVEQAKIWAVRNRTFESEAFLGHLNSLKSKSVNENSKYQPSYVETRNLLDNVPIRDKMLSEMIETLDKTPKDDIQKRLQLISSLITIYSRQKNFSMAMQYFDEANHIYTEHQSSNMIANKDQLEDIMARIFYHTGLSYHRQQDWNMCLSMLTKSQNIILKQNKENQLLPEIYYCMASCYMHRQELLMADHYYKLAISTAEKILPHDHADMQRYRFQYQSFVKALSEARTQR